MRRILLAVTLAVAAVSGVSSAAAQAEQVTVRPPIEQEEETSVVVVVPLISKHGAVPEYRLRHGYEQLYNLAAQICQQAEREAEATHLSGGPVSFYRPEEQETGFASSVARFNEVRHELIPLMRRYGLGYPPSLEDFSELTDFIVKLPVQHNSHPVVVPVGGSERRGPYLEPAPELKRVGAAFCHFELTK